MQYSRNKTQDSIQINTEILAYTDRMEIPSEQGNALNYT